jgi:hypothetical protein
MRFWDHQYPSLAARCITTPRPTSKILRFDSECSLKTLEGPKEKISTHHTRNPPLKRTRLSWESSNKSICCPPLPAPPPTLSSRHFWCLTFKYDKQEKWSLTWKTTQKNTKREAQENRSSWACFHMAQRRWPQFLGSLKDKTVSC